MQVVHTCPGRHTPHTCSRAHARAHRCDAVNTRVPRAQTPDPRQTGAPAHAADAPGRQGGSRFLAQRLKTSCDPQEAGRQGGTEKPGELQPQPSPLPLEGRGHSLYPRPTPPGAPFLPPPVRIPTCTHPRSHSRVPGPPSEPPAPFPCPAPARGVPRRTHPPQTHPVQGRRTGAAGTAAAQTRRLREGDGEVGEQAAFSPPAPTSRGASACRDRGGEQRGDGDHVSAVWLWGCACGEPGPEWNEPPSPGRMGTSLAADAHGDQQLPRPLGGSYSTTSTRGRGRREETGQGCDGAGTLRPDRLPSEPALPLACPRGVTCHFCASVSHSVKWEEFRLPPASTALKVKSKECIYST